MARYVILDLDNCIADDRHRIPHIDWRAADPTRRYHKYHMLSAWDAVGNRHLFQRRQHVLVFTARPVLYRPLTEEWLRRNDVPCEHLIMRNNTDTRGSAELKAVMLRWLPELYGIRHSQIECAYDDRPDVVDAYRAAGIRAEVAAIHDVCAYTNPLLKEPQ